MALQHSWDDDPEEGATRPLFEDVDPHRFAVGVLTMVAWVELVVGVVGAFAMVKILSPALGTGIALSIAAAVLIQGVVVWALFLMFSSISSDLRAVRNHLIPTESE